MKNQTPKDLVPKFFDNTAHTYDKIAYYATFGKDNYWKDKIIQKMKKPKSILDLACGTGILTRKLATEFPDSEIIGVDITKNYLKIAEKNSTNFSNISFIHQDAEKLLLEKKFDCICSSYIPKYCNAESLLNRCILHLNKNGNIILHDFLYPRNSIVQVFWKLHFISLQILGKFIPTWNEAFVELPKLIEYSNWVESYTTFFKNNGFIVEFEFLTFNTSGILTAHRTD